MTTTLRCTYAAYAADPRNRRKAMLLRVTREGAPGSMKIVSTVDTGERMTFAAADRWCEQQNAGLRSEKV
jgi:hypothetical protein